MTKIFFILLALLISSNSYAEGYKNEPIGFKRIKWGISPLSIPSLIKMTGNTAALPENVEVYTNPNETPEYAGVPMYAFEYLFWKGKLMGTASGTSEKNGWENLKKALEKKHGKPVKFNKGYDVYIYKGLNTTILLAKNIQTGMGLLNIYSTAISKEAFEEGAKNKGLTLPYDEKDISGTKK